MYIFSSNYFKKLLTFVLLVNVFHKYLSCFEYLLIILDRVLSGLLPNYFGNIPNIYVNEDFILRIVCDIHRYPYSITDVSARRIFLIILTRSRLVQTCTSGISFLSSIAFSDYERTANYTHANANSMVPSFSFYFHDESSRHRHLHSAHITVRFHDSPYLTIISTNHYRVTAVSTRLRISCLETAKKGERRDPIN